jgi:hypothetical protein
VDDLLAHNVEAFTGMQKVLFGRALSPNDRLHYEFLDNDVPHGDIPLTVAFGWGGEMNVLDVRRMLDVCRYAKVNVNAKTISEVYPDLAVMAAERNIDFLPSCVKKFPQLKLADRNTGRIYARFAAGRLGWTDPDVLDTALSDTETQEVLRAVAPALFSTSIAPIMRKSELLSKLRYPTLARISHQLV